MLAVEERGGADRAHTDAATFVGDAGAECGAFVAVGGEEAELHQFVRLEVPLEFGEEFGREAAFAELERGREVLAEAAQVGLLRAGERKIIHRPH